MKKAPYTCATKHRNHCMSFYSFLADNYELSKFVLPKKQPNNDVLDEQEKERLIELMYDKDFYEINTIIRKRYSEN
jgi:hypothetical protein